MCVVPFPFPSFSPIFPLGHFLWAFEKSGERKEGKQVLKILWAFTCVPRTVLAKSPTKSKFPVLENTLSVNEAKYLL